MSLIAKLLALADSYSAFTGVNIRLLSDRIFADRRRLEKLQAGEADLNTRSFEKAVGWFAENWPEALAWPDVIERPSVPPEAETESTGAAA